MKTASPAPSRRHAPEGPRPSGPGGGASPEAEVVRLALELGGPGRWPAYFGRHARTFRFAARLFPSPAAARVSGLYAWCRFTDDLVDEPRDGAPPPVLAARLDAWEALSREAFRGRSTGVPLLDVVLGDARRAGVAWRYPAALVAGVRMDLERTRYPDWETLERYTFGVAGTVGGWMTQLFRLGDPGLLDQAHALGHGMQLTNILRDVGEDWRRGRLYVPTSVLAEHGLDEEDVGALVRGAAAVDSRWIAAMQALTTRADLWYERAWPGIRRLPAWFRRPVAVAAAAYRGIHDEVRRNGWDNLGRRAHTSMLRKVRLGLAGWRRAGR